MANNGYNIKDLETLSGIKAHTLRIWEQRYHILKPQRSDTNIRSYSNDDLRRILNISLLNKHGKKISKIAELSDVDIIAEVNKLSQQNENNTDQIDSLIVSMIELDEERFEKIVNSTILRIGLIKTIQEVMYPFLQKIGLMWQTGTINPAQEHFISNLIRQKIIVAIDGQIIKPSEKTKKAVLFLPEGELHEISLLFFSYILRSNNHQTIYLGQSVPLNDMIKISEIRQPHFWVTVITQPFKDISITDYITKLANLFPNQTLLISGAQVLNISVPQLKNVRYFNTPQEFIDIIKEF
jgi:DNA-binding transcriptional MerR regulator